MAVRTGGGTDARAIHVNKAGVPVTVISVPVRYAHSHVGVLSLQDYAHTLKLVVEVVRRFDARTVRSFLPG